MIPARVILYEQAPVKRIESLRKKIASCKWTAIQTLQAAGRFAHRHEASGGLYLVTTGILDGAENNRFALTIARHGEVARYYTYDMHTRIPDILLMVPSRWKADMEQQRIVEAAIKASIEFEKAMGRK